MSRILFAIRIEGRYSFRRRIHFRNIISKPLTLALQTADPAVARERVATLAARFVIVRADVKTMLKGQRNLTGFEIEAIFCRELEQQLASWLTAAYENAPWSSSVLEDALRHGEAYRQLRLPDPRHDMGAFEVAELDAANQETTESDAVPERARLTVSTRSCGPTSWGMRGPARTPSTIRNGSRPKDLRSSCANALRSSTGTSPKLRSTLSPPPSACCPSRHGRESGRVVIGASKKSGA